ncbi:MAG: hypothetical protein AB8B86_10030 [Pseudomonadales bacterium]
MANIDLVPDEYRYWIWQQRCMKIAAIAGVAVVVLSLLLVLQFGVMQKNAVKELGIIQADQQISQNQQLRMEHLSKREKDLDSQWSLLNGLRGGATVEHMFRDVDRALDSDAVWFTQWRFIRTGRRTNNGSMDEDQRDGAHVVLLSNELREGINISEAWAIFTNLNVSGGADDHQALSTFVERLLKQQRIVDVRVLNTSLIPGDKEGEKINFDLSVVINNAGEV